jgi:ABC-type Fe3+-citrate transport system substrate-binding protein
MMKKSCIYLLICLLLGVGACSQSDDEQESQSGEEVKSTGQKIVEEIQRPIDKANLAKELTEEHNRKIDENTNE